MAILLPSTKHGSAIVEMAGAGTPTVLLGNRSMIDNNAGKDKSIVNELNFGEKTSKRVTWEAWEFTVLEKGEIQVTNASWGSESGDHSYSVTIEEIDGQPRPTECGCKADEYREEYDCKHKVALASIGGSLVLQAALSRKTPTVDVEDQFNPHSYEVPRADGGIVQESQIEQDTCPNGDPQCDGPEGDDLPCFQCYLDAEGV